MSELDYVNTRFDELPPPKHLGLGRSSFYDAFIEYLRMKFGHLIYQSDFMVWINPSDPYSSLNFYIETAEKIEFSLRGISSEDLKKAIVCGKRAENRGVIKTQYMTVILHSRRNRDRKPTRGYALGSPRENLLSRDIDAVELMERY